MTGNTVESENVTQETRQGALSQLLATNPFIIGHHSSREAAAMSLSPGRKPRVGRPRRAEPRSGGTPARGRKPAASQKHKTQPRGLGLHNFDSSFSIANQTPFSAQIRDFISPAESCDYARLLRFAILTCKNCTVTKVMPDGGEFIDYSF